MIALVTCAVALASLAQPPTVSRLDDRVSWLDEHAVRVRSIDPREEDVADLAPLKAAIGGARVVALGEQSHGDGATFLAKCRLVKFLHREMGFDVLVWESTEFDCREADRALRDPSVDLDVAWQKGIFSIWGKSAQVRPVIEYVRAQARSERPLEVAGMDCQFSSGHPEWWVEGMDRFLAPLDEGHAARTALASVREDKKSLMDAKPSAESLERLTKAVAELAAAVDTAREKLAGAHGADEFGFMRRTIDDAAATVQLAIDSMNKRQPNGTPGPGSGNARDTRMGENLVWLANERYKGRKLIVWAASFHEATDIQAIRPKTRPTMYEGVVTEGMVAKKTLGPDLYTVFFEAYEGSAAPCFRVASGPLAPSPKGGLGEMMASVGDPFLFVDFRGLPEGHWLREKQTMRPLGYMPMEAVWPGQCDAVFFTRDMFPSTKEELAPEGAVLTVK